MKGEDGGLSEGAGEGGERGRGEQGMTEEGRGVEPLLFQVRLLRPADIEGAVLMRSEVCVCVGVWCVRCRSPCPRHQRRFEKRDNLASAVRRLSGQRLCRSSRALLPAQCRMKVPSGHAL